MSGCRYVFVYKPIKSKSAKKCEKVLCIARYFSSLLSLLMLSPFSSHQVSASRNCSLVVSDRGEVYTLGRTARLHSDFSKYRVRQVSHGFKHMLAVTTGGKVGYHKPPVNLALCRCGAVICSFMKSHVMI